MTEKQIFDKLRAAGFTPAGAAGLMGNLMAESGLRSNNLQNSFEKKLGMDDTTYTAAVDSGAYANFVKDRAGYGLAQWTFHTRKKALLDYAQARGVSIGDMAMQLDFLLQELQGYTTVYDVLLTATDIKHASDVVLTQYERPANQSDGVKEARAALGREIFTRCAESADILQKTDKKREFSPLCDAFVSFGDALSNNRKSEICRITPHHMASVTQDPVSVATYHRDNPSRKSSANYYIAGGRIAGGIPETRRAWTSSTGNAAGSNDHTAITIEVANSTREPDWQISDRDYLALVSLCADICKFYGITPHFNGDTTGSITMHKQFKATACPGPYLEGLIRSGRFETDILKAMEVKDPAPADVTLYRVQAGAFQLHENAVRMLADIKAKGQQGVIVEEGGLYKIQVGAYQVKTNAERKVVQMAQIGYAGAIIKEYRP